MNRTEYLLNMLLGGVGLTSLLKLLALLVAITPLVNLQPDSGPFTPFLKRATSAETITADIRAMADLLRISPGEPASSEWAGLKEGSLLTVHNIQVAWQAVDKCRDAKSAAECADSPDLVRPLQLAMAIVFGILTAFSICLSLGFNWFREKFFADRGYPHSIRAMKHLFDREITLEVVPSKSSKDVNWLDEIASFLRSVFGIINNNGTKHTDRITPLNGAFTNRDDVEIIEPDYTKIEAVLHPGVKSWIFSVFVLVSGIVLAISENIVQFLWISISAIGAVVVIWIVDRAIIRGSIFRDDAHEFKLNANIYVDKSSIENEKKLNEISESSISKVVAETSDFKAGTIFDENYVIKYDEIQSVNKQIEEIIEKSKEFYERTTAAFRKEISEVNSELYIVKQKFDLQKSNIQSVSNFISKAVNAVAERDSPFKEMIFLVAGAIFAAIFIGNWLGGLLFDGLNWIFEKNNAPVGRLTSLTDILTNISSLPLRDLPAPVGTGAIGAVAVVLLFTAVGLAVWSDWLRHHGQDKVGGPDHQKARYRPIIALNEGLGRTEVSPKSTSKRGPRRRNLWSFGAMFSAWLLLVYCAAVMTWGAGAEPPARETVLRLVGMSCVSPSGGINEKEAGTGTSWAFADGGRSAFDLKLCDLNVRMPNDSVVYGALPRYAKVAFVIGLASFEGEADKQNKLAGDRAASFYETVLRPQIDGDPGRANTSPKDMQVYGIVLGRADAAPVPFNPRAPGPPQSAEQRPLLVYLAGRRGGRPDSHDQQLTQDEIRRLLDKLRDDLKDRRDVDPDGNRPCSVVPLSKSAHREESYLQSLNAAMCPGRSSVARESPTPAALAGPQS